MRHQIDPRKNKSEILWNELASNSFGDIYGWMDENIEGNTQVELWHELYFDIRLLTWDSVRSRMFGWDM
jgi:hypothetical protein